MSLRLLGFLAASVGAIAGLTAGVGVVTLQQWSPPYMPMIYLASVMLGVYVVMAGVWIYTTRTELSTGIGTDGESVEERGLKRLLMIASQVVLGLLAISFTALWNVADVRARAVPFVTESHVRLEQALRDPSEKVRTNACVEFFRRGWVFRSRDSLLASLSARPAAAKACLDIARENEWKGVEGLADDLADGWLSEMLVAGPVAAPRMCEIVPSLVEVDTIAGNESELRLLACVTAASSDDVRTCCANSLRERGPLVGVLGEPGDVSTEVSGEVFAELVRFGFRPLSLPETRQGVAAALGTDDETVRRWVAQLGCSMLRPEETQPKLVQGFMPLVESRTCNLNAEEQLMYSGPHAWVRVCQSIMEADGTRPIEDVVCETVSVARNEAAVEEAMKLVHEALRAPFLQREADFVLTGVAAAERRGSGGSSSAVKERKKREDWAIFLDTPMGDLYGPQPFDPSNPAGCRRKTVDYQASAAGKSPEMILKDEWTFDCSDEFDGRTFGDVFAERNAVLGDIADGKHGIDAAPDRDGSKKGSGLEKARKIADQFMKEYNANKGKR